MAPTESQGPGKQEAIEQLVSRLAEDVRAVRGGNPVSLKLRQTAVNVLSGRTIGAPGRWEKEAEAAKAALGAEAPEGAAFLEKCYALRSQRLPAFNELLVALHTIRGNPEVRKALAAHAPQPAAPAVGSASPLTLSTPATPSGPHAHSPLGSGFFAAPASAQQTPQPTSLPPGMTPQWQPSYSRPTHSRFRQTDGAEGSQPARPADHHGDTPSMNGGSGHQAAITGRQDMGMVRSSSAAEQVRWPITPGRSAPGTPGPAANGSGPPPSMPSDRQAAGNGSMEFANPTFGQDYASPLKGGAYLLRSASGPAAGPGTPRQQGRLQGQPQQAPGDALQLPGPFGDLFQPHDIAAGQPPPGPSWPRWNLMRPFLNGDFLLQSAQTEKRHEKGREGQLDSMPPSSQESAVMEDLLAAFMGLDGRWARARLAGSMPHPHLRYCLEGRPDPALLELVTRMLPICDHVVVIERFIERRMAYEWGLVSHALGAAMRDLLGDWYLMVTQLEHQLLLGRLTLQAVWFYVQQPLASLSLLAGLAGQASREGLCGAPLLDLLQAKAASVAGNPAARVLTQRLLHAAARPYFAALERWMCEGRAEAAHSEFMVQENEEIERDSLSADGQSAYWYFRYTLRRRLDGNGQAVADERGNPHHDVPAFLEPHKALILNTGKCLNAIRECGRIVERPLPADVHLEYDEAGTFVRHMEAAHEGASRAALELVRGQLGLLQVLEALKHYFLLDRGDLLAAFLDTAEAELAKPAVDISVPRLQSLLELAVRASSAAGDPTGDDLSCSLDHRSLLGMLKQTFQQHSDASRDSPFKAKREKVDTRGQAHERSLLKSRIGREAFMLCFKVDWPLSVVVSEAAMTQYQLIFRHLFELKIVERQLNNSWRLFQATRTLKHDQGAASRVAKRCYGVGAQMQHFFRQYLLYVTFEVLEPLWAAMASSLRAATTLDQVVDAHREFLRRVLKGCLLSRKPASPWTPASLSLDAEDPETGRRKHDRELRQQQQRGTAAAVQKAVEAPGLEAAVTDLEASFTEKFRDFISGLEEVHMAARGDRQETREELDSLLNLMARLDFNHFFSEPPELSTLLGGPL
ncbi:hypothetical protein WJX84_003827 [Apatococcus fuscideae]|uniref:Gamma-tubulin complex component n=1 Tax=Apatococcus fuscideae TaxID=2026836 RepID=A0AAW1T1E9_9CHLO